MNVNHIAKREKEQQIPAQWCSSHRVIVYSRSSLLIQRFKTRLSGNIGSVVENCQYCLGHLRGNWFYTSKSVYRSWGVLLHMWKKLCKASRGSTGSCAKSDKLPHVMSLESALVGAEVWKWRKSGGVELESTTLNTHSRVAFHNKKNDTYWFWYHFFFLNCPSRVRPCYWSAKLNQWSSPLRTFIPGDKTA